MIQEWQRGQYIISTDRKRLQIDVLHEYLSERSYWARGRSREITERAVENSLSFGLYKGERQIGFCRAITDYATFAWLADVFILEEYRGQKLGEWLIETALSHPDLVELRRWLLATRDAQGLYRKYGFQLIEGSERYMILANKS